MHIPVLLLLGSFSSSPSLPHENACFVDSVGKQSVQPYGCCRDAQTSLMGVQQGTVERSPFAEHTQGGGSGILHHLFYCKYGDTCHLQPPPLFFV